MSSLGLIFSYLSDRTFSVSCSGCKSSPTRHATGFHTARIIATALVHSKLDYCNSLYYRLPSSQINQLQVIQNSLARAVTKTPRFCHISSVLQSLHWLNIEQRIVYKLISLTLHFNKTAPRTQQTNLNYNPIAPLVHLQSSLFAGHLANLKRVSAPSVLLRLFSGMLYLQESVSLLLTHSLPHQHYPETLSTNNWNSSLLALISTIMIGLLISICFTDSTSISPHGLSIMYTILLIADNADRPSSGLRAPTN